MSPATRAALTIPSTTTFGKAPAPTFPGPDFRVTATNNSGGAISYGLVSGPCVAVGGAVFRPTGVGACQIKVVSEGTSKHYWSAASQTITIVTRCK
jgi:hypothetical protein